MAKEQISWDKMQRVANLYDLTDSIKEQISWDEMLARTIKQIEDAKKQGKLSVVVDLEDYCDFIRIGWSDPPPLIDRLLRELGDLGYVTYAKLVKDTTLKIEWEI